MDWIERIFHVSPDGGSGSFELGIVIGVLVAVGMLLAAVGKLGPRLRTWRHHVLRRIVAASLMPKDHLGN
jgi:hypothetical protein